MNPKKALRRFMSHLAAAPEGAHFEVGTMWHPRKGWRVYQRIGDVGLAMSSADVRGFVRIFEQLATKPEWRRSAQELRGMFDEMKLCADDVDQKNRDGVVPPDMPNVVNAAGRA